MPTLLILMIALVTGFFLFTAARAAAERAAEIGRDACHAAVLAIPRSRTSQSIS